MSKIFLIAGPTASGKSELAIKIAKKMAIKLKKKELQRIKAARAKLNA